MTNRYQETAAGVLDTTTHTFVPNDPSSFAWQEYMAYVAAGGVTDVEPTPILTDEKANAIAELNRQAGVQREKWIPAGTGVDLWYTQRLSQAKACILAGGTPSSGTYKLLDAEVNLNGNTIMAVANNVASEWATLEAALEAIETARRMTLNAINAASDPNGVATALAGVSWP